MNWKYNFHAETRRKVRRVRGNRTRADEAEGWGPDLNPLRLAGTDTLIDTTGG